MSGEKKDQIYIPSFVAHGFFSWTDNTVVAYKMTKAYNPKEELTLAYDDPEIDIPWINMGFITKRFILSDKDKNGLSFEDAIKFIYEKGSL